VSEPGPGPFAEVSAITPAGPGRFEAEVHPDWTLGGKPNGGYLLAMLGRAAEAAGPHPYVIAASAHYLRSPEPGMVSVEAEVLRAGRGASQVRARMVQRNQACIEAHRLRPPITTFTPTPPTWTGPKPWQSTTGSGRRILTRPAGILIPASQAARGGSRHPRHRVRETSPRTKVRAGSVLIPNRPTAHLAGETARWSTITQIYEGTNQIQRMVMARQLLKGQN
jgi:acyl-coenzyme A thioesterase PaaI-like protein